MAFSLFEIGNSSGRPIFLYEMVWGTTAWRYTSADRVITHGGFNWEPVAISDDGVVQGANAVEFTVNIPANLPIVSLFRSTPPAEPITLRCLRYHKDDPDAQAITYWKGTVGNVKRSGIAKAVIFGLPTTLRRTGLRLCWERGCPHMLYDQDCKADMNAFKVATAITALTGTTITVATLGAWAGPQFAGGFIRWEPAGFTAGTYERRGIESFAGGTTFNLFGSTDRLLVGTAVNLHLGCDLTPQTCDGTFDNLPNYGGFSFMPGKSPFDGTPVF
jgi:uncharacterized phage protein (TIGR02218 family)